LYPDIEYFEVVDRDGNRVPEGQPGELVYTALDWRGTAVVRYRTGDMTKGIEYEPCPHCGRTVPRIHPDLQRNSDIKEFSLTKVKGELVNLNDFYPLLSGDKNIDEWQIEITKQNNDPYGLDQIIVNVAPKQNVAFVTLQAKLEKAIREEMAITPIVREMPLEELLKRLGMETEVKEKRIIDSRPAL
jgi:phenylacetate-coenzyme A ligase PaaK-like adenylate-forming protein